MEVYLRALQEDDYLKLNEWRNNHSITDLLGGNRFFTSPLREKKWVENAVENDRVNLRLAICIKGTNTFVGMVNLTNIDYLNRKAEFSIMIGERSSFGKGLGTQTTYLMLDHAFEQLNLNKVYLTVLEINVRAKSLYKSVGFRQEGVMRQEVYKNGVYNDMILMSLLKEEYGN